MTAPVYISLNTMDNGLAYLKTRCNSVALIDYAYTQGDSYLTVRGTSDANILAERTGISAIDITLANNPDVGVLLSRQATIAAPLTNPLAVRNSTGVAGYLKYAALDTFNQEVLAVIDVSVDRLIYVTDPVIMPALAIKVLQPIG